MVPQTYLQTSGQLHGVRAFSAKKGPRLPHTYAFRHITCRVQLCNKHSQQFSEQCSDKHNQVLKYVYMSCESACVMAEIARVSRVSACYFTGLDMFRILFIAKPMYNGISHFFTPGGTSDNFTTILALVRTNRKTPSSAPGPRNLLLLASLTKLTPPNTNDEVVSAVMKTMLQFGATLVQSISSSNFTPRTTPSALCWACFRFRSQPKKRHPVCMSYCQRCR